MTFPPFAPIYPPIPEAVIIWGHLSDDERAKLSPLAQQRMQKVLDDSQNVLEIPIEHPPMTEPTKTMTNYYLPVPPALQYFTNLTDGQRAKLSDPEKQRMILEIKTHLINAGGASSVNSFQLHCAKMLEDLGGKPVKPKMTYL